MSHMKMSHYDTDDNATGSKFFVNAGSVSVWNGPTTLLHGCQTTCMFLVEQVNDKINLKNTLLKKQNLIKNRRSLQKELQASTAFCILIRTTDQNKSV